MIAPGAPWRPGEVARIWRPDDERSCSACWTWASDCWRWQWQALRACCARCSHPDRGLILTDVHWLIDGRIEVRPAEEDTS